ncbi:MAG: phytanoyl-CoA dioxygenase family protein [Chloroflexi bacterium]|nr:phytanoyl-CoA dioxygenase family protein [Chloroflexota bacterium]
MEIGKWEVSKEFNEIYQEARDWGLESNIAELDAYGFTVIENALSDEIVEQLAQGILRVAEERTGKKPDTTTGETHPGLQLQMGLLFHGRIFEEVLMEEPALVLITYLLGKSCVLSSVASHFKGPGGGNRGQLALHSDIQGNGVPVPLPAYAQVANCNYALTDYTEADDGVMAMVPGSQKLCRYPDEWDLSKSKEAVPVIVPKGSAIIFHGNTFHGSYERKKPGFRINLSYYFCRHYMDPTEGFRDNVPKEMLERNSERFAQLMGMTRPRGWSEANPDLSGVAVRAQLAASPYR